MLLSNGFICGLGGEKAEVGTYNTRPHPFAVAVQTTASRNLPQAEDESWLSNSIVFGSAGHYTGAPIDSDRMILQNLFVWRTPNDYEASSSFWRLLVA